MNNGGFNDIELRFINPEYLNVFENQFLNDPCIACILNSDDTRTEVNIYFFDDFIVDGLGFSTSQEYVRISFIINSNTSSISIEMPYVYYSGEYRIVTRQNNGNIISPAYTYYSSLPIFLTYQNNFNDVNSSNYSGLTSYSSIQNALNNGGNAFIFDRRTLFSNFDNGDNSSSIYPDGSGGTYANNLFLQNADFVFRQTKFSPPYNIGIQGDIVPNGSVYFQAVLNDYQKDNLANFEIHLDFSFDYDIDYQFRTQPDFVEDNFLWFKETSSLFDEWKNVKAHFDYPEEVVIPLTEFYRLDSNYGISYNTLYDNLTCNGVSLTTVMRNMTELTRAKYNKYQLNCTAYLSSQGAKSGSLKEFFNPINAGGLQTDTSLLDNENPFFLDPNNQTGEINNSGDIPGQAGTSGNNGYNNGSGNGGNNGSVYVYNYNTNNNGNTIGNLPSGIQDPSSPSYENPIQGIVDSYDFLEDYDPMSEPFIEFLFGQTLWTRTPFNIVIAGLAIVIIISIITAIITFIRGG